MSTHIKSSVVATSICGRAADGCVTVIPMAGSSGTADSSRADAVQTTIDRCHEDYNVWAPRVGGKAICAAR